jgi:autotransporter-associated beta strand protein
MAPFQWRRWLQSFTTSRVKTRRALPRRRLSVEALEDRALPATFIWTGLGVDNNWSTGGNWKGGQAPTGSSLTLDDLVFPASASQTSNDNDLSGAVFNSITFSGPSYTLSGNALTLGSTTSGSGFLTANVGATGETISLDIAMGGSGNKQFFTVYGGADVTISGHLTGASGSGLSKEQSGTLTLSGHNTSYLGSIKIDDGGGVIFIMDANALGDGSNTTTVAAGTQLQVDKITGSIPENLRLNGDGIAGSPDVGALLNVTGNNTWSGKIELDSDTTIGVSKGSLNISGQISDTGTGHNLSKEEAGTLILSVANSYRGQTTINDGIVEIRDPLALGTGDDTDATATTVNTSKTAKGELDLNDPSGVGFTVANEKLILNGDGKNGNGALNNISGNNTWAGTVELGTGSSGVTIDTQDGGADPLATLTITGLITDNFNKISLTKIGTGTLILPNPNVYGGGTTISAGIAVIYDSNALGDPTQIGFTPSATVSDGATLELAVDNVPDSVTGLTNELDLLVSLTLSGTGTNGQGALYSASGINILDGPVDLAASNTAIGVDPDPSPSANANYLVNDYSLSIYGGLVGGSSNTLTKTGAGQLFLPTANDSFSGNIDIQQGWITIQDPDSLGSTDGKNDTTNPTTTVEYGAALHLYPDPVLVGNMTLYENLVLAGTGITHPFATTSAGPGISQAGALLNLTGENTVAGNVTLWDHAGIGVEQVFGTSQLYLTGNLKQRQSPVVVYGAANGGTAENDNVISTEFTSGTINIKADVLNTADDIRVYLGDYKNDPADAVLLYDSTTNGNLSAPTNLNQGTINITYGPNSAKVDDTGTTGAGWNPGGTVNYASFPSTKITIVVNQGNSVQPSSDWYYTATVTAGQTVNGGITKLGSKLLEISGKGTYTGPVDIQQGVVLARSDSALGEPLLTGVNTNVVTVEPGAALALANTLGTTAKGLDIPGTALVLNGPGNTTLGPNYDLTGGPPLAPLSILADDTIPDLVDTTTDIVPSDDTWEGKVTLATSAVIDVPKDCQLTLSGVIDDKANTGPSGSDLIKIDPGILVLSGNNTYRGTTFIGTNTRANDPGNDPDGVNEFFNSANPQALAGGTVILESSLGLGDLPIAEVQSITVPANAGSFTLTFNGKTTGTLNSGSATLASDIQQQLNNLDTVGGVDGSVSVTGSGTVYTVTFGGALAGFNEPQISASISAVVVATVRVGAGGTIVQDGSALQLQGNLTVAGEPLIVQGDGYSDLGAMPPQPAMGSLWVTSGTVLWTGRVILTGASTGQEALVRVDTDTNGGAQLNILGSISDLKKGGNYALTKVGGGTLILSGSSTYGGVTTVQEGIAIANNANALGAANSGTVVEDGAALELQSDLQLEPITLNGDGASQLGGHNTGALRNISNNNTYTGTLTLNSDATIGVDTGSSLTIGGKSGLLGTGSITSKQDLFGNRHNLVKELTGTLILQSANTYGSSFSFALDTDLDPVTGLPFSFPGGTVVAQGIVNVQNGSALGVTGTTTTVLDGAQLQIQGGITVANEKLRISGSGVNELGALENISGVNQWESSVTLAQDAGFLPDSTPPDSVSIGALLTTNSADQLTIDGAVGQISGSTLGIVKVGAGRVVLNHNNTYGGLTTVDAGALRVEKSGALGLNGSNGGPPAVTIAATNKSGNGYAGLDYNQSGGNTPPDTCGAAGQFGYVETVNQTVALYKSKSSGSPVVTDSLSDFFFTQGALSRATASSKQSDPIVVYDELIGRFIIGDQDVDVTSHKSNFDLAVSQSSNPKTLTSADWNFYTIDTTEAGYDADYPGNFGYNRDAFVFTLNMLGTTDRVLVTSVDASDLANGVSQANIHSYQKDYTTTVSLRPATMHTSLAGDPMWFVAEGGDNQSIDVVKMTSVLTTNPTFTTYNLLVKPYDTVVEPLNPDGTVITDNINSRILKAAEANNTLVAVQAIAAPSLTEDDVRWYSIDISSGSPIMKDEGTISAGDGTFLIYPGIDINTKGQIGISYMRSGLDTTTDYLSMYITGRAPTDPAGTMETPVLVPAGTGKANYADFTSTGFSGGRAGDLSGINVDPVDGSFWAANEFANTDAVANWGTAIANFTVGPPPDDSTVVEAGGTLELFAPSISFAAENLTLNGTGVSETQLLTVSGTAGSLILTFGNVDTGILSATATAGQIQSELNNLSSISNVGGSVSVVPMGGGLFQIVFGGSLAGTDEPLLGVTPLGANVSISPLQDGGTGALRNVSGNNTWTGSIMLGDADPNQNDTPNYDAISVDQGTQLTVTGTIKDTTPAQVPSPTLTKTGPGTLVFPNANTYSGETDVNVGTLNIRKAGALGGVVNEVQTVTLGGSFNGTFALTFNGATTGPLSANFFTDATFASDIESALNGLSSVIGPDSAHPGSVSVAWDLFASPNVVTITFDGGFLAGVNQNAMTATGAGGTTADVQTTQDGSRGTVVASGATLQVQGGMTVSNEPLTLNGSGVGDAGALQDVSTAGSNATWASAITLSGNASIGVTNSGEIFTINQPINDNNNSGVSNGYGVTKVGSGTLLYAASAANTYTGLTQVNAGTLQLKQGGGNAFGGNLTIGQNGGASATAQWLASNQVPDTATVTVNAPGTLDLNGATETVGPVVVNGGVATTGATAAGALTSSSLTMTDGTVNVVKSSSSLTVNGPVNMTSGTISLGAGTTMNLGGDVTATSDATGPALITGAGTLKLGGANRTFTIGSGGEMDVNVPLASNSGDALTKAGTGLLVLGATSTFANSMTVNAGTLWVKATTTSSVSVASGATLQVDGSTSDVSVNGGAVTGIGTVGKITDATAGTSTIGPGDPGTSPVTGTLAATGDVTFDSSDTFQVALKDTTHFDQLTSNGNVNLNNINLSVSILPGATINANDSFTIIKANSLTANSTLMQGSVIFVGTLKFNILYDYTPGASSVTLQHVRASSTVKVVASTNPSIYGQKITYTAIVTPEGGAGAIPGGDSVTFTFDGVSYPAVPLNSQNHATFDPQQAIGGPLTVTTPSTLHTLVADFGGDAANFLPSSGSLSPGQTVNKATTTALLASNSPVVLGVPTAVFGDAVTITVTLGAALPSGEPGTAAPSGNVTFSLDGTTLNQPNQVQTLTNGQASITFSSATLFGELGGGTHSFNLSYSGDGNFKSFSTMTPITQLVSKAATSVSLQTSASSIVGDSVTFTATVSTSAAGTIKPTGRVSFYDGVIDSRHLLGSGAVDKVTGVASLNYSALSASNHTIIAVYNGDGNFNSSSFVPSQPNVNVSKRDTSASLSATPTSPSTFGQAVTFTATISPAGGITPAAITGTVLFDIDHGTAQEFTKTVTVISGQASFRTNPLQLSAGTHTITASYGGDSNYNAAPLATVSQMINATGTNTALIAAPTTVVAGHPVIFTATVTSQAASAGSPTGMVEFKITSATGGSTNITQDVTLIGGANLQSTAQYTFSGPVRDTYKVTATYLGAFGIAGSSAQIQSFVVSGADSITTVNAAPSTTVTFGQALTLTANVSAATNNPALPTGSVNFVVTNTVTQASQTFSASVNAGTATTQSITGLAAGTYTVQGNYSGDTIFNSSVGSLPTETVQQAQSSTAVSTSANSVGYGQTVTFTATVTSAAGKPTGSVTFHVTGGGVITDTMVSLDPSTGQANLPISNLTPGSYTVSADFSGGSNSNFAPSSGTLNGGEMVTKAGTTTTVDPVSGSPVFGQPITLSAHVSAGSISLDGGSVHFFDGLTDLGAATSFSLATGQATLSINTLAATGHSITAQYSGDNILQGSTSAATSVVIGMANTSTLLATTATESDVGGMSITATVSAQFPSTITPAEGSVTFTVTNTSVNPNTITTYVQNLNGSGVATLPALSVGTYVITAVYTGTANLSSSNGVAAGNASFISVKLDPTSTSTTVSSSQSTIHFGQQVTFTAQISAGSAMPTGNVLFSLNNGTTVQTFSRQMSGGQAQLTFSNLDAGSYAVSADYTSDSLDFGNSSGSLSPNETVLPADTSVKVTTSASPVFVGQSVTFTATVSTVPPGQGTPTTGTVNFFNGATLLGSGDVNNNGVATLLVATADPAGPGELGVGNFVITATYGGSTDSTGDFAGSTSTTANSASQEVDAAASATATLPSVVTSGRAFAVQPVTFFDPSKPGVPDTAVDNLPVTLSLIALNGGQGVLGGQLTVTALHGQASFTNLTIAGAGSYALQVSLPNLPAIVLPGAIQVTANRMVPTFKLAVSPNLATGFTLQAVDANGTLDSSFSGLVRVKKLSGPSGSTLTGTLSSGFSGGTARLVIKVSLGGRYTLQVVSGDLVTVLKFSTVTAIGGRRLPIGGTVKPPAATYLYGPLSPAAQAKVSELRDLNGFTNGSSYRFNRFGLGEKSILDQHGNTWIITMSGLLEKIVGGLPDATHALVVDPLVWFDPTLLTLAPLPPAAPYLSMADVLQLASLQTSYRFSGTGNFQLNQLGKNEKHITSSNNGQAYLITRDDNGLTATISLARTGAVLAEVNALVWDDPTLLFNA